MFSNRVIKNSKLVVWESGKWKEGDIEIETVRKRERESGRHTLKDDYSSSWKIVTLFKKLYS